MNAKLFPALAVAIAALAGAPAHAQEVFAAGDGCAPMALGDDAAMCGDADRIAQMERETGSTARVFDQWASQSMQGELGRFLETHKYTAHSGVCLNKPNRVVLFVRNNKMCDANKVSELFAAADSDKGAGTTPAGGGAGGGRITPVPASGPPPGPGPIPGPSPRANVGRPAVAGSNPCQPFGKGGYDFCQNPRGTRLPAGCACEGNGGPTGDAGRKGIVVDRRPQPVPLPEPKPPAEPIGIIVDVHTLPRDPPPQITNPPSDGALFNAINDCLSFNPIDNRKFYYYDRAPVQPRARKEPNDLPVTYEHGVVYYDSEYMAVQTPWQRALFYADAFAQHAQELHDKRFGAPEHDSDYDDAYSDMLENKSLLALAGWEIFMEGKTPPPRHRTNTSVAVGYIYRCLQDKALVPQYPNSQLRNALDDYLDAYDQPWPSKGIYGDGSNATRRLRAFSYGYGIGDVIKPISLLPPKSQWLQEESHPELRNKLPLPYSTK